MMDTSDGLMDAVFKMAESSKVTIEVDFEKVPYDKEIEEIAKSANVDYKDWILYGGEDFQIIACVNKNDLEKSDPKNYTIIGKVKEQQETHPIEIRFKDEIKTITNLENTFDHFKETL
jgi:thiamine-monophosphate kinase